MGKFTLEFKDATADAVKSMALKHGVSQSELIRKALNLMTYIEQQRDLGDKLLLKSPDGTVREIISL